MNYTEYTHQENHQAVFKTREDALVWLDQVRKVLTDKGLVVFNEGYHAHSSDEIYATISGELLDRRTEV